jgi:hypothetical protein
MVRFIHVSIVGFALLFSVRTFSQSLKWESLSTTVFENAKAENNFSTVVH